MKTRLPKCKPRYIRGLGTSTTTDSKDRPSRTCTKKRKIALHTAISHSPPLAMNYRGTNYESKETMPFKEVNTGAPNGRNSHLDNNG